MRNVVLFQPEIPPNTGNIGRLCHATGTRLHLIEPFGFSLDDKSVRRAGLDYWSELEVATWPDLESCLASRRGSGGRVWYLTTKATRPYWDVALGSEDWLVFGPETRGLPDSILSRAGDQAVTIPQRAGRSLNLATAVGIVLYEAVRQEALGEGIR